MFPTVDRGSGERPGATRNPLAFYPFPMQERLLAEKLIGYDTSNPEGVRLCAGFIKGWF